MEKAPDSTRFAVLEDKIIADAVIVTAITYVYACKLSMKTCLWIFNIGGSFCHVENKWRSKEDNGIMSGKTQWTRVCTCAHKTRVRATREACWTQVTKDGGERKIGHVFSIHIPANSCGRGSGRDLRCFGTVGTYKNWLRHSFFNFGNSSLIPSRNDCTILSGVRALLCS